MSYERPPYSLFRQSIDFVHKKGVYPWLTRGEAEKDREIAHHRALEHMKRVQEHRILIEGMRALFTYNDPAVATRFLGQDIKNPLFFSAGIDKKGEVDEFLCDAQGFGGIVSGSFTEIPFEGNKPPRLFLLRPDLGFINRMKYPGDGTDPVIERWKKQKGPRGYMRLASLGASTPSFIAGTAVEDALTAARKLAPYSDGIEHNISTPNTPGQRAQQTPEFIREHAVEARKIREDTGKPFGYKLSPDLPRHQLYILSETIASEGADYISIANTTTSEEVRSRLRSPNRGELGGISGEPLRRLALEQAHIVYEATEGKIEIKGGGGISEAEHMWEMMTWGGANVVELLSGFVHPETSTPNFSWYKLQEFHAAMRVLGIRDMKEFHRDLRGQRVPYPRRRAA